MAGPCRAVLFDWRGTLFHNEDDAEWIRASAASTVRALTTDEVKACVAMLSAAAEHPEVVAARQTADCSAELHRAAVLLELRLATPLCAVTTSIPRNTTPPLQLASACLTISLGTSSAS